jgi:hypothetical protein
MYLNIKDSSATALRVALLANAVFSTLSGLLILFAEPRVLGWLGLQSLSIWPIGAGLLLFAAYLFWMSRSSRIPPDQVKSVILGDWAWVAGTAVLLLIKAGLFSGFGIFLLVDVAAIVALFAYLQGRGLKIACRAAA